jgi:hypothetical protein
MSNNGHENEIRIVVALPVGGLRAAFLDITANTTVGDIIAAIEDLDTNVSAKWKGVCMRPRYAIQTVGPELFEQDTIHHVIGVGENMTNNVRLYYT